MIPSRSRRTALTLRIAAAGILVAGGVSLLMLLTTPASHGSGPNTVPPAPTTTKGDQPTPTPRAPGSLIATLTTSAREFAVPEGASVGTIPPTWHDAASSLPVVQTKGRWLRVRLAPRPNGSTAWIERSPSVVLTETPYRIVIDLATRHLELFHDGVQILDAPAGIGTSADPTPTGDYFLAFFAQSPSSGYGPFVIVTSAHSNEITDWEKSGDAMIAIHGPLGADAAIGTTGAAISHGCVRLHNADLEQLRDVPAGSPIDIIG